MSEEPLYRRWAALVRRLVEVDGVDRVYGKPPWRQPRGKWMVSLVNSHTNATSKMSHLWEID